LFGFCHIVRLVRCRSCDRWHVRSVWRKWECISPCACANVNITSCNPLLTIISPNSDCDEVGKVVPRCSRVGLP
jgi:hypothetical protein